MIALALATTVLLHATGPSPSAQLAAAQRAVPYHIMELPQSMQLVGAEISRAGGAIPAVRLEYSNEGAIVFVVEQIAEPSDGAPSPDMLTQLFNLDGYPAAYREFGTGYRHLSAVTWYRPDVTVTVSSRDLASAAILIDVALELR